MPEMPLKQGIGYKSIWDMSKPDEIIYIQEYAYEKSEDGTIAREDAYSIRDFVNLVNGDAERAKELFSCVDWQYPTTGLVEDTLDVD